MRTARLLAAWLAALAAAWGCTGGAAKPVADAGADGGAGDYWDWASAPIPGQFVAHGYGYSLFAAAADDVAICAGNLTNGTGGVLSFDGAAFAVEAEGFVCAGVWGLDAEHVFAFGFVDQTFVPKLLGRSGGVWAEETVAGADDSCRYDAVYGPSPDALALVGACGGERLSWVRDGAGSWIAGDRIVPSYEELDAIYGVLSIGAADVFYGSGLYTNAPAAILAYEPERALWAGGAGDSFVGLQVLEGNSLLAFDPGWGEDGGDAWSEVVACPYDIFADEYALCWKAGALDAATGDVYLGGGRGSATNENVDDRRLDRLHDGALTAILAPCGGAAPRCGVADLSLAPDRTLFAIASDPQPRLLWAALPSAD